MYDMRMNCKWGSEGEKKPFFIAESKGDFCEKNRNL